MESIEKVTRHHLQSHRSHHIPIQQVIIGDALKDQKILSAWEGVTPLPSKYKPYSIELLRAIITVWTNMHCFAFAKGRNEQFEKKFHKHVTRSTFKLKKRRTEKEPIKS